MTRSTGWEGCSVGSATIRFQVPGVRGDRCQPDQIHEQIDHAGAVVGKHHLRHPEPQVADDHDQPTPVSYTHLDVYKRQGMGPCGGG